jgi:hypothetical protein
MVYFMASTSTELKLPFGAVEIHIVRLYLSPKFFPWLGVVAIQHGEGQFPQSQQELHGSWPLVQEGFS